MGFHHALSGLNAASKNLDVIGHNIANSGTTAFKSSRAEFSEAVASALGSSSGQSYGIGVTTAAITQQFKQGNLKPTGNNLDVAINGNGFFVVKQLDGTDAYTRAGSFRVDQDGYLRTVHGDQIMGKTLDPETGKPLAIANQDNDLVAMQFVTGKLLPAKQTTEVDVRLNLDARAPNAAGDPTATPPIDATPRATYGTSLNVHDQQGASTPVHLYFEKGAANQWNVFGGLDDMNAKPPIINPSSGFIQMDAIGKPRGIAKATEFDATGKFPTKLTYTFNADDGSVKTADIDRTWTFTTDPADPTVMTGASYVDSFGGTPLTSANFAAFEASATASTDASIVDFKLSMKIDSSKANPNAPEPFDVAIDLNEVTQYGVSFSVSKLFQDGYQAGHLNSINISEDGSIIAQYDNGVKQAEARLMLATFRNVQGLASIGGDKWAETKESGLANKDFAKTSIFGSLHANTLEESNVDLTAELVDMMTAQRAYQASAQAIKTQDQVFSTLVNLR
ncbi:MAG: flagellar hook protein FlgE [Comamonas sp.]|nr:flagellar hook protein FlgE [Comamonas sp.]